MAQIPLGSFESAQVVPRTNRSNVDNSGALAAGRAIEAAGQTGMQIAGQALNQQQAQRTKEQNETEALARAKAANGLLDHELQTRSLVETMQSEMADGSLDWRKAEESYQERYSKIAAPEVPGLDAVGMEQMQGGLRREQETGRQQLKRIVDGARRTEFKTQFDTGLDTLGKLAGTPGADVEAINAKAEAFAPLAAAAGVDASTIKARIQTFKDRNWTNQATNRLIGAREDAAALTALEKDLTDEKGFYTGKLDTDRRNALLAQIKSAQVQIENRDRAQADKREAAGARAINEIEAQLASGIPTPVEQRLAWAETVKGTSHEAQATQYIEVEKQAQELLKLSPAAQRSFLQQMDAKQQTAGATMDQRRIYNGLKTASDARIRMLKEQPLQHYAVTTGQQVAPLDIQALTSGNTALIKTQLADRMNILAAQRKRYGGEAGMAPLLPQEATVVAAAVTQMQPKEALQVYGALRSVMPDDQAYNATMQQIAPDSPVRALAGTIFVRQAPGAPAAATRQTYGDISLKLLQGEQLLNPGKGANATDGKGASFPMPNDAEMQAVIAESIGNAFEGREDEYRGAIQAVRAYYAATSSEEGDRSKELDGRRMRTAIDAVMGEAVDIEGREVLPPWGMPADEFEDAADEAIDARLRASGLTDPGDVSLMAVKGREGAYMLVRGRQIMVDKGRDAQGRPIPLVIRIGGPR